MTITYETIFEILRKERNHEDLQKLNDDFFEELKKYIEEKSKALNEKPRLDQFIEGHENEQQAIRIQLQNIKKIAKDIFDRREHKIIEMAINKAKTGSNIVDTSSLLPEEKVFFDEQIELISGYRARLLEPTLTGQKPSNTVKEAAKIEPEKPKELNTAPSEINNKAFKKVNILEEVPKFVGIDLEIYGPFKASEEVELNQEIAEMLVKTNKAKIVE